jgi:hypothetical protein
MRIFAIVSCLFVMFVAAGCEEEVPPCDVTRECVGGYASYCIGDAMEFFCDADQYHCIFDCNDLCALDNAEYAGKCEKAEGKTWEVCWCKEI